MIPTTQWSGEALPIGQSIDRVLYDLRRDDAGESLLLDSTSIADIMEDSDGMMSFDALVMPFAQIERKMALLNGIMQRTVYEVKTVSVQVSEPFKQRGVANVAAVFELSDGQTVSIFFHNPDVTPNKMAGTDEIISWKWLLNKKDITIVVAPERGEDLNVREVARRIMKLAEKNSAAFQRANGKRAETLQRIEGIKAEVVGLEKELKTALSDLEVAKFEKEDVGNKSAVPVVEVAPEPEPIPSIPAVEYLAPTPPVVEVPAPAVAVEEVAPTPPPVVEVPEPTPTEDPQKTADKALFQSVIDGTIITSDGEGMLSPEVADLMEAAYFRNAGNADMEALFIAAANSYQEAGLSAADSLMASMETAQ